MAHKMFIKRLSSISLGCIKLLNNKRLDHVKNSTVKGKRQDLRFQAQDQLRLLQTESCDLNNPYGLLESFQFCHGPSKNMKCHQEPIFTSPVVSIVNKLTHEQSPISPEDAYSITCIYIYFFFLINDIPEFSRPQQNIGTNMFLSGRKVTENISLKSITTIKIPGLKLGANTIYHTSPQIEGHLPDTES